MKKLLLFILLAGFSFGYGQNLSLSQLMSLRTMDLDEVEMFLTQKGWNYKDGAEMGENNYSDITFQYGSVDDKSYSFLQKVYSNDNTNRILVFTLQQKKYFEYITSVKSFKPKLIFSGAQNGDFLKIYQGETITFIFTTTKITKDLTFPTWSLLLWDNQDFDNSSMKEGLFK